MPIYRLLTNETAFTPEDITAIEGVFEAALRELGLVDRSDPLAEMVAKRLIELAKRGDRDPDRLLRAVLALFDGSTREAS